MLWYKSRAFWTLVITFVFNILVFSGVIPTTIDVTILINMVLGFLAGIFRWDAQAPLATTQAKADEKMVKVVAKANATT